MTIIEKEQLAKAAKKYIGKYYRIPVINQYKTETEIFVLITGVKDLESFYCESYSGISDDVHDTIAINKDWSITADSLTEEREITKTMFNTLVQHVMIDMMEAFADSLYGEDHPKRKDIMKLLVKSI